MKTITKTKLALALLTLSLLLEISPGIAQPVLEWAKAINISEPSDDLNYNHFNSNAIAVDDSGNVFNCGTFMGTVDFDPSSGIYNLTTSGGGLDVSTFISKLNANGNLVWAKQLMGHNVRAADIDVDAIGNIYLAGVFYNTGDFDPSSGIFNMTSTPSADGNREDIFVCKLDNAGNFIWAKQMGGESMENVFGMDIDADGNVYTTGVYYTWLINQPPNPPLPDFDPSSNVYTLGSADIGGGAGNTFVSKLDANGNFVWAKQFSSAGVDLFDSFGTSIDVDDENNNVYIAGIYNGTVDFDPSSAIYNLSPHGRYRYTTKLTTSGDFVWAKNTGSADYGGVWSIAVDKNGNSYTTGHYVGINDFDPSTASYNLTSTGYDGSFPTNWMLKTDVFVSKLDAAGNLVWAKSMGGADHREQADAIVLDKKANIYIIGLLATQNTPGDIADYDPGAGVYNMSPAVTNTVIVAGSARAANFIVKLDSSGSFLCAGHTSSPGVSYFGHLSGKRITVDKCNNTYVAGEFSNNKQTADFDPDLGTFYISPTSVKDFYVSKLQLCEAKTTVFAGNDTAIAIGNSISLTAVGNGNGTYLWSTGANTPSITVSPLDTATYCVTLTDADGCRTSDCVVITIDTTCGDVFVPNAFSPNNDGSNDVLYVKVRCGVRDMEFKIFDRWGNNVFESTDATNGWDGTYGSTSLTTGSGKEMDVAVFVYYLQAVLTDGKAVNKKGNISLIK